MRGYDCDGNGVVDVDDYRDDPRVDLHDRGARGRPGS